ncbi:GNAT family N-acetyltransferase [Streptomyces sp. URMC 123]|uniref:GNAT family N-acetyltransferase n=1 Tax=Streptomyces sp. URMC 123 TaxID=3423403 RepID=UPI003F19C86B
MSTTVTTWYLEQTSPADLVPAAEPAPGRDIRVIRAELPSPELSRFLYTTVGADVSWTDQLGWTREQWRAHVERPGVETWIAYERGTPAGYIELMAGEEGADEGAVEIRYFGLLPDFRGRGIGGHLLTVGTARAWDLGERRPELPPTKRVWLHTCSKDGPYALENYRRRGFRVFRTVEE